MYAATAVQLWTRRGVSYDNTAVRLIYLCAVHTELTSEAWSVGIPDLPEASASGLRICAFVGVAAFLKSIFGFCCCAVKRHVLVQLPSWE